MIIAKIITVSLLIQQAFFKVIEINEDHPQYQKAKENYILAIKEVLNNVQRCEQKNDDLHMIRYGFHSIDYELCEIKNNLIKAAEDQIEKAEKFPLPIEINDEL